MAHRIDLTASVTFRAGLAELPHRIVPTPGAELSQLATNESPFGPLPSVAESIAREIPHVNRYPDDGADALVAALGRWLAVPESHVVVGAGSLGLLRQLFTVLGEPGVDVVIPWRSFDAYPRLITLSGAMPNQVPLRAGANDLGAMLARITGRTRAVIVCNPNNPTGPAVDPRALLEFLDDVPPSVLVILDEAYHEYASGRTADGLDLYRDRPNVAVLRTFSKAYGLAALRVGYLVAHEPVAAVVRKAHVTYEVGRLAQVAALACISAGDELLRRVATTVAERDRVRAELLAAGWRVPPSEGNFLWLPLADAAQRFAVHSAARGVAVKSFVGEGVRATIGTPAQNAALLDAAVGFATTHTPDHSSF